MPPLEQRSALAPAVRSSTTVRSGFGVCVTLSRCPAERALRLLDALSARLEDGARVEDGQAEELHAAVGRIVDFFW